MKLIETTIGEKLRQNAGKYPDREAVVFHPSNFRRTWSQLDLQVDITARAMLSIGLKKGDHIAIWGTNVPEWLITEFAAARIGVVLVTINPEWKGEELKYALKQSDSKALVMIRGFEKISGGKQHIYNYLSLIRELCPELETAEGDSDLQLEEFPELKRIIIISEKEEPGMQRWDDFIIGHTKVTGQELRMVASDVQADDTALIQYTSGTTGFPKGAMLTHHNVINDALVAAEHMELTEQDRVCGPVPFYHCFGSILLNLGCLNAGATIVIPAEHFNPHSTLEVAEKECCTAIHGVPTMFITELQDIDFDKFDLHRLRTGIMAGAPVDKELMEAVTQRMGCKYMTIGYGLTEASPITHQTDIHDTIEKRVSTVGRTIDHTEAKIVDPITMKEVGIGEVGEIWVKGFHVMEGYYKKPEETDRTIVDGWLRSGDLGTMDEDGYFRIVGRLKEMIIVGGHNVYPAEVEQSLHTLLDDKLEILQVVGVPHPKLQEVVALVAKCHPGKEISIEEIRERCDGKLEWPKIPKYLKVMDDFSPVMTVTGKIQKFKLRELLTAELSLN